MLDEAEARSFMTAAALTAAPRLAEFPPQAISNLCWAVGGMPRANTSRANSQGKIASRAVNALVEAAAQQAAQRVSEFSWQDLACVIVALAHGRQRTSTTNRLATQLVIRATDSCHQLSTQVMLNIALSATRLNVQHEILRQLVIQIGSCIAAPTAQVSPIDLSQWAELQNRCPAFNRSSQRAIGTHSSYSL